MLGPQREFRPSPIVVREPRLGASCAHGLARTISGFFALSATANDGFACIVKCGTLKIVRAPALAMPLVETEALVLRTYRLGEADKIVSLFTRQMGRVRAVASGAQRTKSRYGGTLESLSYVRLWFYERENRDLARLNSVEIIESFFDMQKDYASHVAAQYVVEVSERLLPEREVNERIFRLLLVVLRSLKRFGEIDRPLVYFNYWMLRLGGFLPDVTVCGECGRTFDDESVFYGPGISTLAGKECRIGMGANGRSISAKALAETQAACGRSLEKWMQEATVPKHCKDVRSFLEFLMEFQAERKLITRDLLAEVS
jgi:DNA repair protein RecO (recombination protein O)